MRAIALIALTTALVAGCEDRPSEDAYMSEADVVEALPAEDYGADAAAVSEAETAPPPAVDAPPETPDERSSAESVQPESETLFY